MKELTVLYAEDDLSVLGNTAKVLSYFFKTVLSAKDGQEAIDILTEKNIDVLITDYVMPKKTGFDVICEAKKRHPNIIVFVTSSYTDLDILLSCIPLGITEYLIKPISYDRMLSAIDLITSKKDAFYVPLNDNVLYHTQHKTLIIDEEEIKIGRHQIKLIEYMIKHRGQVVDKTTLMNYIYGETVDENLLKNLIFRLRKKVDSELFCAVKSVGYILK